ncbi:hypothetical protein ACU8KH_03778 [Lachancea thermotolerans]
MLHEETVNLSILVLKKRYFSGSLCKGQKACSAFKAISNHRWHDDGRDTAHGRVHPLLSLSGDCKLVPGDGTTCLLLKQHCVKATQILGQACKARIKNSVNSVLRSRHVRSRLRDNFKAGLYMLQGVFRNSEASVGLYIEITGNIYSKARKWTKGIGKFLAHFERRAQRLCQSHALCVSRIIMEDSTVNTDANRSSWSRYTPIPEKSTLTHFTILRNRCTDKKEAFIRIPEIPMAYKEDSRRRPFSSFNSI